MPLGWLILCQEITPSVHCTLYSSLALFYTASHTKQPWAPILGCQKLGVFPPLLSKSWSFPHLGGKKTWSFPTLVVKYFSWSLKKFNFTKVEHWTVRPSSPNLQRQRNPASGNRGFPNLWFCGCLMFFKRLRIRPLFLVASLTFPEICQEIFFVSYNILQWDVSQA